MIVIAISPLNYHGIFAFYIVPVATLSALYIFYLSIRMRVYKRLKDGLWELGMVGIVLFIANAYISQIMTQGFYVSPPIYLLVFILAQVFMWNRQINQLYLEKVDLTESLELTNQSLRYTLNSLKKSELTLLRAQIKPHFLFNAINSIIAVSMKDAKQARELLFKLGEYLHYQFDFDKDVVSVPFSKELESIEAYLTLEKVRFKDRLNVIIDAREINFSVPPLLIQPLVENAIRHGLMVRQHGGTLTLRVIVEEQTVQISVEDDGVGISEEIIQKIMNPQADEFAFIKTGVGLANINQRLLKEYGTTLHIALRQGGGTIVSLRIPNRKV
jgi:LytS/YehU family sensor histidine kinase